MIMNEVRRVVVTGAGTVNPLGNTVDSSWTALLQGQSGIAAITQFNVETCPVKIAGEVKGLDITAPLSHPLQDAAITNPITHAVTVKDEKKMGRFTHLGVIAGLQAYIDSGLSAHRGSIPSERIGVNIGVGMGGLPEIQKEAMNFQEKGYRRISPFFIFQSIPNLVSGQLSILLQLKGPNHCNVTACATSAHSIGESFRLIKNGHADVMLSGGAEAVICELGLGGFAAMRAASLNNDNPTTASRPFDQDRDGFVMGEGATVLVLEEYEHAKKRGAFIYGEIVGYGASSDAFHLASPSAEGEGAGRAIEEALKEARLDYSVIDYVNAHATSTPAGDTEEAKAIHRLIGSKRLNPVMVSSTKSQTGHLLGAAGATEALFSLLTLRHQTVPPTMNLDKLDSELMGLNIDFIAHEPRQTEVKYVLSNSFGFGSTNGCLIFAKI